MNGFCFHANRLNEILYLLNFFAQQGEKWIFRGQSNAEWPLKSSLERAFEQFNVDDIDNKIRAEQHIIEMGDRTLRPYVPSFIEDKLDLLAFIQHFGGITRLLDFTDSFAVALFFASETSSSDVSVWCLKRNALRYDKVNLRNRNQRRAFASQIVGQFIEDDSVIAFAPSNLNKRLYAQQGLFLMPCTLRVSTEDLLTQKLGTPFAPQNIFDVDFDELEKYSCTAVLLKINVHKTILRDVLVALRKMNVSANHLFPGVSGICRSLSLLASGYRLDKDTEG